MDLPGLFNPEGDKKFLFLSMLLADGHVQAALWQVKRNHVEIVFNSKIQKFTSDKDCLVKADQCLQELGPDSEDLNEVVFGFESNWLTKQSQLAEAKKPVLKKLTEELNISAVGFVSTSKALPSYLISQEPLISAICIYLQAETIELFLFKQGKLLKTVSVGRSGEIKADLVEGLARLSQMAKKSDQYFPARLLLVSLVLTQEKLHKQQQAILSNQWSEKYPFLQAPTVELLPLDSLIRAVTKQGGEAVAKNKGLITQLQPEHKKTAAPLPKPPASTKVETEEFGFSDVAFNGRTDQDQAVGTTRAEDAQTQLAEITSETQASSFGVPIKPRHLPDLKSPLGSDDKKVGSVKPSASLKPQLKPSFTLPLWTKLKTMFSRKKTPPVNHAQLPLKPRLDIPHKRLILVGFLAGLLALGVIGYLSLVFSYTAKVKIKLKIVPVSKEVEITLDPQADQPNAEDLILNASLEFKELSAQDTFQTSGVKLVGEKASGKVILFNKTDSVKTFEAGTVLTKDSLEFTLNEEVQVASASESGDGEGQEYGKAEVMVTATEIGAESNLAQDTALRVAKFGESTYAAKVAEDLTGGSSREVRVVSQDDCDDLLATVTKSLKEKAEQEFAAESGEGRYVVPSGDVERISTKFNAEVGDEVDSLDLDLTLKVTAVSYLVEDLKPLAFAVLASEVKEGYELMDQDPEVLSSPTGEVSETGQVVLLANLTAKSSPSIQPERWQEELGDQNLSQAQSYLQQQAAVEQVEIQLKPLMASWLIKNLPQQTERIQIEIIK